MDSLDYLIRLCDEADRIALYHYTRQTQLKVLSKGNGTPVSDADLEIERMIRDQLTKDNLSWDVWGEEFGACSLDAPTKLIIDPIDATRNFIRGLPIFATLLGLEENGEITTGVVSAPALGQRWWAQKGKGSFCNGAQIHVSSIPKPEDGQIFHGSLFGSEAQSVPQGLIQTLSLFSRQRGLGDFYSHVMVASGAGECCVDFGLQAWDKAPLKIIVEEAGGKATNLNGSFSLQDDSLICSNGQFHDALLAQLKGLSPY